MNYTICNCNFQLNGKNLNNRKYTEGSIFLADGKFQHLGARSKTIYDEFDPFILGQRLFLIKTPKFISNISLDINKYYYTSRYQLFKVPKTIRRIKIGK